MQPASSSTVEDTLLWRGDPEDTFSDFAIAITTEGTETSEIYHVHRNILAFGPRKSNYFAAVFRKSFREGVDQRSEISLESFEASVFPAFLDFVYNEKLDLSHETVFPIMKVAAYFDCPALLSSSQHFVSEGLKYSPAGTGNEAEVCKNALLFLDQALKLDCSDYIEWTIRTCIVFLEALPDEEFLSLSPAAFEMLMGHPFHSGYLASKAGGDLVWSRSMKQSRIACQYLEAHPEVLDSTLLGKLTRIEIMFVVDKAVAHDFLAMVKSLSCPTDDSNWPRMVCLMRRCFSAMDIGDWKFEKDPAKQLSCMLEQRKTDPFSFQVLIAQLSSYVDQERTNAPPFPTGLFSNTEDQNDDCVSDSDSSFRSEDEDGTSSEGSLSFSELSAISESELQELGRRVDLRSYHV